MYDKYSLTDYYKELNDFYGEEVYELGYDNEIENATYTRYFERYYNPLEYNNPIDIELKAIDKELYKANKLNF